ncbi:MAG TPA: hypothetical protein VMM56_00025 [Planctomycetaceae bacterium]|nr:hypothetical protein [Planctomycetaceae bacterium]
MLTQTSFRSFRWFCLALATICVSQSVLSAQDEKIPVEQIVPDKTVAILSVPDVEELKSRFGETVWSDFFDDPEMSFLREKILEVFDESMKGAEQELGISPKKLLEIPTGEISLAVSRISRGKIGVMLSIEYGEDATALEELLAAAEKKFEENKFDLEQRDIEGTTIYCYSPPTDAIANAESVCWFQKDGFFVVTNQPAMSEAVLVRWDGKNNAVLSENGSFRYTMERCRTTGGQPAAYWYLDPIGLVQVGLEAGGSTTQQAMIMAVLPQLGLDRLKAIGGTYDFATEKFEEVSRTFVYAEGPHRGILKMLQAESRPIEPPKWVSAKAESFISLNWDIKGAWSEVRTLVDSFQGAGALDVMLDRLADHPDSPGLHPQKDFIDLLSGTIQFEQTGLDSSALDKPESLIGGNIVVALGLNDADRMTKVIETLQMAEGSPLKRRAFQGATIYEIDVPNDVSVSLMVSRKTLFLSSDKGRIEQIARGDDNTESLSDSAAFRRLTSEAPESASIWGLEQTGLQVERLLDQVKAVLLVLDPGNSSNLENELEKLPSAEALKKYATDSFFYAIPDERGVYLESHTPRIRR